MRKHYKTYFFPFLVIFALILPTSYNKPDYTLQNTKEILQDEYALKKPSFKHQSALNPNKTLLPKTNLSVNSYIDTNPQDIFNVTVSSLNKTHWFIHCDYSISSLDNPSFDSILNRTSINHTYEAFNYWDWEGNPNNAFDFWIDTSGFYEGYQFDVSSVTATVSADTINMANIGQSFDAWKITIDMGIIIIIWYAVESGLFICMKQDWTVNFIWYNLTKAEIALPPEDYSGPYLNQVSHSNNSKLASSTLISFEFASPYGTDIIYYHWDNDDNSTTFSSFFNVNLPEENASHDIFIIAFDNVGYYNSYSLVFITDNTSPGISLLNYQNNSIIQGSSKIRISVSSGNGNITYYWNSTSNTTVSEGTPIDVANSTLEMLQVLNVFAESPAGIWSYNRFVFTIDNTPPNMTIENPINNSIIKGTVNLRISVSERSNLTYSLGVKGHNGSILVETIYISRNHTKPFSGLENGSYKLEIAATDEANNINTTTLLFSIHTSAFDWNWDLIAGSPTTLNIIDATGKSWFKLTLTSKTNQKFNLTILPEATSPTKTPNMLYVLKFTCDTPDDILFMTFILFLNESSSATIDVYKWVYWDNQENEWFVLENSYNAISHSWEATHEGSITLFALIKTDETTSLISVIPGGGQIPSFEFSAILMGLFFLRYLLLIRKKSVKKTLNRFQSKK